MKFTRIGAGCLVSLAALGLSLPAAGADAAQAPASPLPQPAPAASAPAKEAEGLKLGVSVTLRQDFTEVQDKADLLLDGNGIDGYRGRIRFSVQKNEPEDVAGGGIRLSTGENPNPTSPFVRVGDGFRPWNFTIDQYYFQLRPFHRRAAATLTVGKMPQPFWRGDQGYFRSEMIWDDDVSPVGVTLTNVFEKKDDGSLKVDNVIGFFPLNEITDQRFVGLTEDPFLVADQLLIRYKKLGLAASYYSFERLNGGLLAPNFLPDQGTAFVTTPASAFLLRPGFQATNAQISVYPGANAFRKESFRVFDATAQVHGRLPWFESFGKPEVFVLGEWAHNFRVPDHRDGYGGTIGLRGGAYGAPGPNPWGAHFTWRSVDADTTLATFADSDLGAGTDVKGFEVSANYRITRNVQLTGFFFQWDGSPDKSTRVRRVFIDLTWDYSK